MALVWAFMATGLCVTAFAAPDTCADTQQHFKTCARKPYDTTQVADIDECCALCAQEAQCVQWSYSPGIFSNDCHRTDTSEPAVSSFFTTCGVKSPAPGPSPPPSPPSPPIPGSKGMWAVIAAGSSGFGNYRHQADACHAYQLMVKRGIPAEQIILMMEDDVANSAENPFKGKLFNKNGSDVPDVYAGCKVDYRGSVVTAKLFLSVITGDSSGVPDGGKVLKSGPNDRVFLNFVDHGGVNIVAFPHGPTLHSSELAAALKTMTQKKMFNELVFYMEACESGSMFPGLASDTKILAVTAANAHESSWGYYCMPDDKVNGKHLGSCLGDLFSISWMEDLDVASSTESIRAQVAAVTKRTSKSHVMTFGDMSFENEAISNFALSETLAAPATEMQDDGAIDSRDIALRQAYEVWARSPSNDEKDANWAAFRKILEAHDKDDMVFSNIVSKACDGISGGCEDAIKKKRTQLEDNDCHIDLVQAVHDHCPRREQHSESGWNEYNMKFSYTLVNLCEAKGHLGKDSGALRELVIAECGAASRATSDGQMLV